MYNIHGNGLRVFQISHVGVILKIGTGCLYHFWVGSFFLVTVHSVTEWPLDY